MKAKGILIDKQTVEQFVYAVGRFAASAQGVKAKIMLVGLIALLLGINGMNVLNNYVGRDFMTAIEHRDRDGFARLALVYLGVFAGATLVSVLAKVLEDRLALLWREFITQNSLAYYLADGAYYRLENSGELENPDQRIAEDVRVFTVSTLSLVVMILNSSMTIVAFSEVVWLISPLLFGVAVVYAACGSYLTIKLGRPLVGLNYSQLDKEANFRSTLIHVRENAEPLFLAHREGRLTKQLVARFDEVATNLRKIINVNRNLGFFTGGYYWLIGLIPSLIVAPAFMDGKVEFGVVTQSVMAFSTLVGAFSLIITQFQSISTFTAVVARLKALSDSISEPAPVETATKPRIEIDPTQLAYVGLSLHSSHAKQSLLKDLSVLIPLNLRVLVSGQNLAAGVALFKATAGLWNRGDGKIMRPNAEELLFLAEKPYLPPGTLREILVPVSLEATISDDKLTDLLHELKLESVLAHAGGLHGQLDWDGILSLADQQLLNFIHVLLRAPRFVFLDRADTALSPEQILSILQMLTKHAIGYVFISQDHLSPELYDAVLEIDETGGWNWKVLQASQAGSPS